MQTLRQKIREGSLVVDGKITRGSSSSSESLNLLDAVSAVNELGGGGHVLRDAVVLANARAAWLDSKWHIAAAKADDVRFLCICQVLLPTQFYWRL